MDIRFGNLTTQAGQKIGFENFDKDNDGIITEQEYSAGLKEYGLDTVELANVDNNNDKTISKDEFQLWEQKIKMEEALQPYLKQVTLDFTGKNSQYAAQMTAGLHALIDDFAESQIADAKNTNDIAAEFVKELPNKYAELKNNILAQTPSAVKSRVIDDILAVQVANARVAGSNALDEADAKIYEKQLGAAIDAEATKFVNSYKGDNLELDLKKHLNEFISTNDKSKVKDSITEYTKAVSGFGGYVDSSELELLKDEAVKLLTDALNNGVKVTLGGSNYTKADAIKAKIAEYTDADALKTDVENFINGINTKSIIESSRAAAVAQGDANEIATFTAIKGAEYQVDASEIDFTGIDGYFDNEEYIVKGKRKQSTLRENLEDNIRETLDSTIKDQMRAQINAMLLEKGVSPDKLDMIFENIYNQSLNETLEADGMIKTKNKTSFRRGNARCNIKDVVDTFITNFNTNITKTMDAMNASQTDMETADIDYTVAGKMANGKPMTEQGVDLTQAYADRKTITVKGRGSNYYKPLAEKMINNLKSQFLQKAKSMCVANGIEFDEAIFTTKFNNAKATAVEAAITGRGDIKSAIWSDAGWAAAGAGAAVGTGAAIAGGITAAGIAAGPAGWAIVGGAALVSGIIALFGGGKSSECSLDTGALIDTFNESFVQDYSAWVAKEKADKS